MILLGGGTRKPHKGVQKWEREKKQNEWMVIIEHSRQLRFDLSGEL